MKKFINRFFCYFGYFTLMVFCSYFITKGETVFFFPDGVTFGNDKKALVSFLLLIIGCLALTLYDARKKKEKQE